MKPHERFLRINNAVGHFHRQTKHRAKWFCLNCVFLMQEITMHEITMQGSQFDLINSYNLKDYMVNTRIYSCLPETTPS